MLHAYARAYTNTYPYTDTCKYANICINISIARMYVSRIYNDKILFIVRYSIFIG